MFAYAVETKKNSFLLSNRAGFALVYVMAVSTIVSVFIALSLNFLSVNLKSREQLLKKTLMTTIVQNLRNQLYDGVICPQVLGNGLNTVAIGPNAISNIQLQYAMQGGSSNSITTGWTFENNIRLARLELRVISPALTLKNGVMVRRGNAFGPPVAYFPVRLSQSATWPLPWVIPPASLTLDKYLAEIRVVPDGFPFNFTDEKNVIRLYIKVSAAGQIVQCHGEVSEAESCEARGMAYDGISAPVNFRCNPDFYCRKDIQLISTAPVCTPPYRAQLLSYEASSGNRMVQCAWCNP